MIFCYSLAIALSAIIWLYEGIEPWGLSHILLLSLSIYIFELGKYVGERDILKWKEKHKNDSD